jgi:hypothetical protein
MGDKIICFHTLLEVLILKGVTGEFSISADSKALAEMARAVSPFLVSLMDQGGFSLYTLSYYTILFIFVKEKLGLEPHLCATLRFPFWGFRSPSMARRSRAFARV